MDAPGDGLLVHPKITNKCKFFFNRTDCGHELTDDSGKFQTPNFPNEYPNELECLWHISVKPGHYVALTFDVFEVESYKQKCIDVVEIKDGSDISSELLGEFGQRRRRIDVVKIRDDSHVTAT